MNETNNKKSFQTKYIPVIICGAVFLVALVVLIVNGVTRWRDNRALEEQKEALANEINMATFTATAGVAAIIDGIPAGVFDSGVTPVSPDAMLAEYKALYEQNQDLIGWLRIEDTVIDYPVMQTPADEDYYLYLDFNGNYNQNGCLMLDTDSEAGVGIAALDYAEGVAPSTNLIIHGHTMKSGEMFGDLSLYEDKEYGMAHNIICFDSLYEKREYELIAVFYSQVYYQSQNVFKYYKFFQADTQEEFDDWYNNIKKRSIYDTGVTAEFGDEFITLSCCAYHVEDGRFVVVGRRIK